MSEVLTRSVSEWVQTFGAALQSSDVESALGMFEDDCYWRDLVSFSWNIATFEGKQSIASMLTATLSNVKPSAWRLDGEETEADGITEGWFTFETSVSRGKGHVRLRNGRCWTLFTSALELKGFEEKKGQKRPIGAEHGVLPDRKSWLELKAEDQSELGYSKQPYCVIIGGGQGGIALGARLKQLNVPTIVLDKHERPGDNWRSRYKSLCLHDPVWYDHLPYLPFPENWPVFSPKDKLGDWLEMYATVMELNYWGSSECKSAAYDSETQDWTVVVDRGGSLVTLHPKQLVFATGVSGIPNIPHFRGAETFEGIQHHSSGHSGGEGYEGRKCVVIGSNNSAHDICADLWEHGADVTMIQRSSTLIARSETLMDVTLGALYSEAAVTAGMTTEKADHTFASIPYRLLPNFQTPLYEEIAERDASFYKRLTDAGFMLDFGEDGSGLFMKYLRRGSGYYIDVGASDLIADGKIKLKSGVDVLEIKKRSILLTDGSELPADVIVYATGYGTMTGWVAKIVSQDVADAVGNCWGLGSNTTKDPGPWEGELRNMYKPTRQDGLWFHGGNLHQSRYYSLYLALQLKARMENIPTPVFRTGETDTRELMAASESR